MNLTLIKLKQNKQLPKEDTNCTEVDFPTKIYIDFWYSNLGTLQYLYSTSIAVYEIKKIFFLSVLSTDCISHILRMKKLHENSILKICVPPFEPKK